MRDAAEMTAVTTAKLRREMDERECKRRNALSKTSPGLRCGRATSAPCWRRSATNEAFLVEFNKNGKARKASATGWACCIPTEIEVMDRATGLMRRGARGRQA